MIFLPSTLGVVSNGQKFDPAQLSPALWFDASDLSTITESSGSVSEWRDRSGNSRHVTQAAGTSQPALITNGMNGLPVVRFDGSSDRMDTASLTLTGRQHHLMVVRTASNGRSIVVSNAGSVNEATVFQDPASSPTLRWGIFRSNAAASSTTTSSAANTAYVVSADFNGSSSRLRVNGIQAISGTVGTANTSAVRLGANPALIHIGGDLAEVVIVSGSLTAGQIGDWEAYAAAKWGITI